MKIDLKIGSKEWLEFRRTKIMASDSPIIMGVSPWCDSRELYFKKKSGVEKPVTPAMQRGIDLEPEAREKFEQMTGHFVWPAIHQHPQYSFLAATFDGINDAGVLCEIKCPGRKDHEEALSGKIPEKYYPQLQHQMYVAGVQKMYYFSYHPDHKYSCALVMCHIDEIYCYDLMQKAREFIEYLQTETEPPESQKVPVISDTLILDMESSLSILLKEKKEIDELVDGLKEEIYEKLDGKECKGNHLHFKPSTCKGSVDYKKVCEAHGITDAENYRRPSFQKWTIKLLSET